MGIVLRYMNENGYVIKRFLVIVHILDTSAISLKNATNCLVAKPRLYLLRLIKQGYNGASNMRGEINCLRALILNESLYARYIHCFVP